MNFIYSPSQNLFFDVSLKSEYVANKMWPDDGIEVSDEVFTQFINAPEGKMRAAGKDGNPVWVDIPPLTKEQLVANATAERNSRVQDANGYINNKQWPSRLMLGRLSDADKTLFNKWLDYIDALNALDLTKAPDIAWPQKPD